MEILIFSEILHVLLIDTYEKVCGNCFILSKMEKNVKNVKIRSRHQNKVNKNLLGTDKENTCAKFKRK